MMDYQTDDYIFCDFEKYCKLCKHKDIPEVKDPCNECLDEPVNLYTSKPTKFEEE